MGLETDVELGRGGGDGNDDHVSSSTLVAPTSDVDQERKSRYSIPWPRFWSKDEGVVNDVPKKGLKQVEDYPQGYPRFSALISSHPSFSLCRRFSNLRARLLLRKQDRLALLEGRLERLDAEEGDRLALGSIRRDDNEERLALLAEIDEALLDYDSFLERHQKSFAFDPAPRRAAGNLRNWVDGNGSIARAESEYLEHGRDLVSVGEVDDNAAAWLEALVEDVCVGARRQLEKSRTPPDLGTDPDPDLERQGGRGVGIVSRDANVHVFTPASVRRAVRALLTPLITLLLLTPVVVCNFVAELTPRLIIVVISTTGFIAIMSGLTRTRTVELIVAGATYTTVLVVFISSNDGPTPD
ncbi:hypothetical protein N3K66_005087 [Trichothecium roseum]|uniref:Uncharacterized protein n=1 Tax=Trichothecium roseum TaxID=47278 RepID=A0ACC0V350_9HYPO|nr:hypothetical protein N3K66_005087 [Trichothecium roseum]